MFLEILLYSLLSVPHRYCFCRMERRRGKGLIMDQDYHGRVVQLEARMQRMEVIMQALLNRLGIAAAEVMPQEPMEIVAIRAALLAGDKIKAIQLFRSFYGVGLREAKEAIDLMEGTMRRPGL